MRNYIRHSASMPIEFEINQGDLQTQNLQNVSAGGLCFFSDQHIPQGVSISINIPHLKHSFTENCSVAWCTKVDDKYRIGVMFENDLTAFRLKMIEQVCHIEDYRKEIYVTEGRKLSAEEASQEWLDKFANRLLKI